MNPLITLLKGFFIQVELIDAMGRERKNRNVFTSLDDTFEYVKSVERKTDCGCPLRAYNVVAYKLENANNNAKTLYVCAKKLAGDVILPLKNSKFYEAAIYYNKDKEPINVIDGEMENADVLYIYAPHGGKTGRKGYSLN
jgi:hypothetical protein